MDNVRFNQLKIQIDSLGASGWRTLENAEQGVEKHDLLLEELAIFIQSELQQAPCDMSVNPAIILMAQNIGCAIDMAKHQPVIASLRDSGNLSEKQEQLFYDNENRRQG